MKIEFEIVKMDVADIITTSGLCPKNNETGDNEI